MRQGELSWRDRGRLWMRLGIRMILVLLIVLALRYLVPPLLGLLMPFALALVVAWVLNPLVKSLQKRLGLSRGVLSLLLILLAFAVAGGILFGLGHSLVSEISSLIDNWEGIWESLQGGILTIGEELDKFLAYLPDEVETFVNESLDGLNAWLSVWVNDAMVGMGTRAKDFAFSLPSFVVALIVFIMATYFITADYPHLRFLVTDKMPGEVRDFFSRVKHTALGAFAGYVRAEVIISIGVFAILLAGFLLIRQPYSVLLAVLLAVLDFIPIIGAGTVMVPWAVIDLFTGNLGGAIRLMVIWGLIALFRRVGEPKFVGDQTGLSPILSLVSIYVGMRLGGVLGMIFGPTVLLIALNLVKLGLFDGVRADAEAAVEDVIAILRERPESE